MSDTATLWLEAQKEAEILVEGIPGDERKIIVRKLILTIFKNRMRDNSQPESVPLPPLPPAIDRNMCQQQLDYMSGIAIAMDAQTKALYESNMRNTSGQKGRMLDRLKNGLPVSLQKDLAQAVKLLLNSSKKLLPGQNLQLQWDRVL